MAAWRTAIVSLLAVAAATAAASPAAAQQQPCAPHSVAGSVIVGPDGQLAFRPGIVDGAVAHGVFVDSSHTASNFGRLRIITSGAFGDLQQTTAAGYLEGYLTAARIEDHHHNLHSYFKHQLNASLDRPMQWVDDQETWLRAQVAVRARRGDAFWQVVGLLQGQLDGLYAGYAAAGTPGRLQRRDLQFLNANGELYDVIDMFEAPHRAAALAAMTPQQLLMHLALQGKCSALIKVTADLGDLLMGHSTWDSFTAQTRIYKHYEFNLREVSGGVAAQRLSFSSYPGELFSDDDMYITSAQMVVLETTNHIYDFTILQGLTPHSVPSWQRVRAANLLAGNGSEWVSVFRRHNSGTYNNQYMVLDLKRFIPRRELQPGLLWVAEQLPGMVEAADLTDLLSRGYFASYNVAVFRKIYEAAGYPKLLEDKAGNEDYDQPTRWLMYQSSPRANLFRRDQGRVSDLASLKSIMRSNSYATDPLSGGHPVAAICSRGDLAPGDDAVPKGCFDTKVTSYWLALDMTSEVVGGPTTAQGQLPPFEWTKRWSGFEHRGMPDRFEFEFERQTSAGLPRPGLECDAAPQPAALARGASVAQS